MSINLLPRADKRRQALRRQAVLALLGVVALWAVLGAVSLARLQEVADQVDERDAVAERVELIRVQVDSLAAFQELATDVSAGNSLLAAAMAREVSWGRLLLQLSRTVPTTASFTAIQGAVVDPEQAATGITDLDQPIQVGQFVISGYSTQTFTPGLRELLLRVEDIDGFFQQYVTNAILADLNGEEFTQFDAEVRLDEGALTDRYADGLPGSGR